MNLSQEMGIQGLLPALKSVMNPIHVKDLAGNTVAVDTYSWLHKGAFSCSRELCHGLPTRRHIDYCMHRVNLLRHHGIKPILIFDGGFLPMKSDQEAKRARARKENFERAIEHESCGNQAAAYECYQKAVDISPSIAFQLIQVLRQENVEYIVAPYEADAQMAFLSIKNHVAAVITEDSDLIPFGCQKIIFKMDKYGNGVEFQYAELARNKDLSLTSFTKQMVLEMCILSGCDYLQSLQGMGIKRAHGLIRKFKSYEKVIKHLRYSGISIPPLYEETFKKAILTFRHQRVYDPVVEDIVHLTDLPCNLECDSDYFGPPMPQNVARAIAMGEIDPVTKAPFQEDVTTFKGLPPNDRNANGLRPEKQKRVLELPVQKNILTNYFCLTSMEAKRQFRAPRIMPGADENIEELLFRDEENGLCPNRTSNFEGTHQEEPMSGLLNCTSDAFRKNFLSGYLETGSKESRDGVNACEHGGISGRDGSIKRKDFEAFEISAKSESDITTQATCSRKSSAIVPSKKITGSKFKSDVRADKVSTMKRETIVRSSYFCSKATDNVDLENAETEFTPRSEELSHTTWDVDTGRDTIQGNWCTEHTLDVRNASTSEHNNETRKTNHIKGNRLDDALTNGKRKHIPTFRSDLISNSTQQEKFACDLSHLEQYSVIAEQSMERFVSTISSFRCSAGGARASGLRAPLKSVTTQKAVRTLNQADASKGDFSKFTYQSNNCNSRPAGRTKPNRSARPTDKGEDLSAGEFGR